MTASTRIRNSPLHTITFLLVVLFALAALAPIAKSWVSPPSPPPMPPPPNKQPTDNNNNGNKPASAHDILPDKTHLKDQVENLIHQFDPSASLPKESTQDDEVFLFFSLHDFNKDHHLDGHELRAALTDYSNPNESQRFVSDIKELDAMIDNVLKDDDLDGDGKISWEEYLRSQSYHS